MNFSGEIDIKAQPAEVWAALSDPEVLRRCIPGCEELQGSLSEGYSAVVIQKIGPMKAKFRGKVTISELVPDQKYTLAGQGDGGIAGFAKGESTVTLSATQDGTHLVYEVTAAIGGKMAQLGNRLMSGVVSKLTAEFFANFREALAERVKAEA